MAKVILTQNFTLDELCATNYPQYQRTPDTQQVANLAFLAASVLQPLRDKFGQSVVISSGFRSPALNLYVGGVSNSFHLTGLAADIRIKSEAHGRRLFDILRTIPAVDLCLFERSKSGAKWLHVQTCNTRTPRRLFNYNYVATT